MPVHPPGRCSLLPWGVIQLPGIGCFAPLLGPCIPGYPTPTLPAEHASPAHPACSCLCLLAPRPQAPQATSQSPATNQSSSWQARCAPSPARRGRPWLQSLRRAGSGLRQGLKGSNSGFVAQRMTAAPMAEKLAAGGERARARRLGRQGALRMLGCMAAVQAFHPWPHAATGRRWLRTRFCGSPNRRLTPCSSSLLHRLCWAACVICCAELRCATPLLPAGPGVSPVPGQVCLWHRPAGGTTKRPAASQSGDCPQVGAWLG